MFRDLQIAAHNVDKSKNIFKRQLAFAFVTDLLDAGLGLCRLQIRATFTCIA